MKGSSFDSDCELTSPQTLVLVGRKGNGKSATGNSILGKNVFLSALSSSCVTTTCEMKSTELEDGQTINIIETPGIVGSFAEKEIFNCIDMAGDGIHAFLVVLSIRNRFSKEEEAAIKSLLKLFGSRIYDYMVLVFTGGDQLDDDETLHDFLHDCPEKLKEILNLCENRCVLFDNKTQDETKRSDQVEKLLSTVSVVAKKNDGKLYNKEMFDEWMKEAKELEKQTEVLEEPKSVTEFKSLVQTDLMYEGQFKQIFEMVEPKLRTTTMMLEQQIAEEQAARLKAEEDVKAIQKKSVEEISYMKKQIDIAKSSQKRFLSGIGRNMCIIM